LMTSRYRGGNALLSSPPRQGVSPCIESQVILTE
jgi:hypothetical protein